MTREPLSFLNGRFIPQSELAIAFHDAGFVFGATVTDFCRTYRHQLFRWPDHLARLRRDCESCFVPLPYSDAELTTAAEQMVRENTKAIAANDDLALITFATPGPLGYMVGASENGPPTVAMHTFPIPKERYRRFFTEGVTLEVVGPGTIADDPVMQVVKHRSRMHWWLAGRRSTTPQAVPVLTNSFDAPDTAIGAILCVSDGAVYAPEPGTVLDSISIRVVEDLCRISGVPFAHRADWLTSFHSNDTERLLVGSAFGVAGVRQCVWPDRKFDFQWPGPVFQKLATTWSEMVGLDIVKQFTD